LTSIFGDSELPAMHYAIQNCRPFPMQFSPAYGIKSHPFLFNHRKYDLFSSYPVKIL
jgi:hypothetical protein